MATSMDSRKPITINIADTQIECSNIVLSRDRHAITVSMLIRNVGTADLFLSVNNLCLAYENTEIYAQHCYINDGQSFEVISGWCSFLKQKSYTLIMKYTINPNLPKYNLLYKTTSEQYLITSLNSAN